MLVNSLSFGNYNAGTLINNPPYITNHPFYEYMRDNKLDFDSTDLRAAKTVVRNTNPSETQEDNLMNALFAVTAGAVGTALYVGKNKLKAGYRKAIDGIKHLFKR